MNDLSPAILALLCLASFAAGFVDAVAGGGGLIQVPAGLVLLPGLPVATVIGTLKVPALSGTSIATIQYARRVDLSLRLLWIMCLCAFAASFAGSSVLTLMKNHYVKQTLFFVLVFVALYTILKKDLGMTKRFEVPERQKNIYAIMLSVLIGFYDGFIGPGTGSFLILGFVAVLGYDFLHASAHAKMVNLATNLASIFLFALRGHILFSIALPMAVCNAIGGYIGARTALAKGNRFVRMVYILVVAGTLFRFSWDVFLN